MDGGKNFLIMLNLSNTMSIVYKIEDSYYGPIEIHYYPIDCVMKKEGDDRVYYVYFPAKETFLHTDGVIRRCLIRDEDQRYSGWLTCKEEILWLLETYVGISPYLDFRLFNRV